jgi:hypothetical protein
LKQPVGKGAFPVVNMGNDAEITDMLHSVTKVLRTTA